MTTEQLQKEVLVTFRTLRPLYGLNISNDEILKMAIEVVNETNKLCPVDEEQVVPATTHQTNENYEKFYDLIKFIRNRDLSSHPDGIHLMILKREFGEEVVREAKKLNIIVRPKGKTWIFTVGSCVAPF